MTLTDDFSAFTTKVFTSWGLDDITCRLFALVYLEPTDISIEELSKKSGFSLASVSNKMKMLNLMGVAERKKRPHSKMVYYYIEKDIFKLFEKKMTKIYDIEINPAKKEIPLILKKYKNTNDKKKWNIINNYLKQIKKMDKVLQRTMDEMKK